MEDSFALLVRFDLNGEIVPESPAKKDGWYSDSSEEKPKDAAEDVVDAVVGVVVVGLQISSSLEGERPNENASVPKTLDGVFSGVRKSLDCFFSGVHDGAL